MRSLPALLLSLSLLAVAPAPAHAAELAGVTVTDTTPFAGKTLTLSGTGLRSVLFIKVYVIGLWTESKATSTSAALSGAWKTELHLLRGLDAEKITDGIQEGFERNSAASIGALQERLDRFKTWFPKVNKGDVITLGYDPARGTVVAVNGKELGTIDGKDFGDALLKVWLGDNPVQDDMKAGMLGG